VSPWRNHISHSARNGHDEIENDARHPAQVVNQRRPFISDDQDAAAHREQIEHGEKIESEIEVATPP